MLKQKKKSSKKAKKKLRKVDMGNVKEKTDKGFLSTGVHTDYLSTTLTEYSESIHEILCISNQLPMSLLLAQRLHV